MKCDYVFVDETTCQKGATCFHTGTYDFSAFSAKCDEHDMSHFHRNSNYWKRVTEDEFLAIKVIHS